MALAQAHYKMIMNIGDHTKLLPAIGILIQTCAWATDTISQVSSQESIGNSKAIPAMAASLVTPPAAAMNTVSLIPFLRLPMESGLYHKAKPVLPVNAGARSWLRTLPGVMTLTYVRGRGTILQTATGDFKASPTQEKRISTPIYLDIRAERTTTASSIDSPLLLALCMVESSLRPKVIHRDDGGEDSVGLCQIKVSTARWLHLRDSTLDKRTQRRLPTQKDLLNPMINLRYAKEYLEYQLERYNGNKKKAITAYNAGHWTGNLTYYRKVMKAYRRLQVWTTNSKH